MSRRISLFRWAPVVVLAVLVLEACGSDRGATATVDSTAAAGTSLSELEAEVVAEMQLSGVDMTQQEIKCLAVILVEGMDSAQDAFDKTAPYETITAAVEDLAPGCFSADRLAEIQDASDRYEREIMGRAEQAVAGMWTDVFLGGGASQAEAECMAAVQAADVEGSIPVYGTYEADSEELFSYAECATTERVAEIFALAYRAPLAERLVAAGATEDEAACLVGEIGQIDLWFPSGNFEGDNEAQMAADIFERDGVACGDPERLREIALSLHGT